MNLSRRALSALFLAAFAGTATLAAPALGQPAAAGAVPTPLPSPVLPQVPEVAPGYAATPVKAPPSDLIGVTQQPFVGIKLEDAIAMALSKNTDLAIAQANRRIASYQVTAAKGAYDLRFMVTPSYEHQVIAPVSAFQAGPGGGPVTQDQLGANSSLMGQLQNSGTQVQFSASGQRVTNNSTVDSFNPYYLSALSLNVDQPLLRGLSIDDTRRQIYLAEANKAAYDDAARLSATNTIVSISDAYWDLVSAWRTVAIQEEGLKNALAQSQTTRRSALQGSTAPVDVTESNAQVAIFQDNVLSALENVQRQQTALKTLILADPSDPIWTANLVPTSNVGDLPAEPTLDDVLVQALRNRPEIAQLADQHRAAEVNLAYTRDQLKPKVDLQLGYTTNGFAGQPASLSANPIFAAFGPQISAINALIANANRGLPPGGQIPLLSPLSFSTPPYVNGNFGTSVGNLGSNRFPVYSVQLNMQVPLGNRTAKGTYEAARETERSLDVQQVGLIQRIKSEAYNALQTLREARYRLTTARIGREAAESVLASEERKYAAGTSTTFLVLQRQLDLANQRGRELQAQTDLNKAVVELQRVTGTIAAQNGFDIEKMGSKTLGQ